MALPTPKVEIGFDLTDSPIGPFFRLDNPESGLLDNVNFRLGGTIFYDVTDRVRLFSVGRGKPRRFASFPAGNATVEFNNHDRAFDPVYVNSPFYGNIIPRREIRISSNGVIQFTGWIDDWNLTYTPDGDSIAESSALDAMTIFSSQLLSAGTPSAELTGSRINQILSSAAVNWPDELRAIDSGTVQVGVQPIEANTNALTYLQSVDATEAGLLFIGKDGKVTFRNRRQFPTSENLIVFGQNVGIPYCAIGIVYGSELLFNSATIANVNGGTAIASDQVSIDTYGKRELSQTNLLGANDSQSVDLAVHYVDLYSSPEYRVESLELDVHSLTAEQQQSVLNLEIGSICKVEFTPNNIGDPIERFIQVIRVEHSVTPSFHKTRLGFQEIKYLALVLNDPIFGKLDNASLG